jgi:hypothetical protein
VIRGGVRVVGLAELQKDLRELDAALPRQLRLVNKEAADVVVDAALDKAHQLGGVAAHAAEALKSAAEQRRAVVTLGNDRHPEALGAEFGATKYRQFRAWRGSGDDAGYFLWPAIRETRDRVVQTFDEALGRLLRSID